MNVIYITLFVFTLSIGSADAADRANRAIKPFAEIRESAELRPEGGGDSFHVLQASWYAKPLLR